MDESDEEQDLPLMANVDDILVRHYNLDFACDLKSKRFTCRAILFLEPILKGNNGSCLCSKDIRIKTRKDRDGNANLRDNPNVVEHVLKRKSTCLCCKDTDTGNKNDGTTNLCNNPNGLEHALKENNDSCLCSTDSNPITTGNRSHGDSNMCNNTDGLHSKNKIEDGPNPDNLGFVVVLDCHQIEVKQVVAIHKEDSELSGAVATPEELNFSTSRWALKIWRDRDTCRFCFPRAIRISYETVPSCPSLQWVEDQLGKWVILFSIYLLQMIMF